MTPWSPKEFDRLAGTGVEFHQPVAGGIEQDALIAIAVRPVGDAAARQLARRDGGADPFIHGIDPFQLAGLGIQRHHVAPRAGRRVDGAVDLQRGAFQLVFRTGTELVGLEMPGDFQLVEVGSVDLCLG